MLKGIDNPSPFEQFKPIVPKIGTLSCISSVGANLRITLADSPYLREDISRGVTDFIHEGISNVIFPVSPLPVFVMVKG